MSFFGSGIFSSFSMSLAAWFYVASFVVVAWIYWLRIQRKRKNPRLFIILEGIIGAGKSTLLAHLAEEYRQLGYSVTQVHEPVDIWIKTGILDAFYKDLKKLAYTFQSFVFATRTDAILDGIKSSSSEIVIVERHPITDRYVFGEVNRCHFSDIECVVYDSWCDSHKRVLSDALGVTNTTRYVFIDTAVETCMKRIEKRNRPAELQNKSSEKKEGLPRDYLERLRHAHLALLQGVGTEMYKRLYPAGQPHPIPLENVITIPPDVAELESIELARIIVSRLALHNSKK